MGPLDTEFSDEIAELEASLDSLRDLPAPVCKHHLAIALVTAKRVGRLEDIVMNGLQSDVREIKGFIADILKAVRVTGKTIKYIVIGIGGGLSILAPTWAIMRFLI